MANLLMRTWITKSLIGFLLLVRAESQASAPTITSPPNHVYQRQDDEGPNFVGYIPFSNDFYDTQTCAGSSTYYTWSRWAGCVTNQADLYTGCTNTSVVLVPTGKGTCSTSMTCGTGSIYNNPTDSTALAYIRCFSGTTRPTYYRQKRTTSITTTFATTTTTNALTGARDGPTSTSTSSTASSSPTETPAPKNLAWVAGPVVGGVAGLAIIALLVWIVLLLRKRQSNAQTPENQFVQPDFSPKPGYQAQISPTLVPDQPSRVVSMDPTQNPRTPPYELEHVRYHGPRHGA